MRLLLLADFSGKAASERPTLASRPTQRLELDTFDAVMQRSRPRVSAAVGEISFEQIDDFHPDRLYASLDLFQALREARANPPADTSDLLGRLLGKPAEPGATPPPKTPASTLDAIIRNAVAPHIVKDTSAQTKPYLAAVDAAIAEQMRALLHDPAFQAVESTWRGVHWLMSNLELDDNLQLHLFDVSRDELIADIIAASAGRSLAPRTWRPGLVGIGRVDPVRSFGHRCRVARRARAHRVAGRRTAARRVQVGAGRRSGDHA
jgi:type VI secretion system protein ImpC